MKLKVFGLFACLLIAGCGSATSIPKHVRVSAEEVSIGLAKQTIALGSIRCIREEQRGGEESAIGKLPETENLEVSHATRELIAAFRKNPKLMRTKLAEEAESLQGCWPWLTREIRTVLTYG